MKEVNNLAQIAERNCEVFSGDIHDLSGCLSVPPIVEYLLLQVCLVLMISWGAFQPLWFCDSVIYLVIKINEAALLNGEKRKKNS